MLFWQVTFWLSLSILLYAYIGYPFVLGILSIFKKNKNYDRLTDADMPALTHIIAAYNEEEVIAHKIKNSLSLDYPNKKIRHIVVTDGSDDQTVAIVKENQSIDHFHQTERKGKLNAINRIMEEVDTEIIVFSDANTMLSINAFRDMVQHFQNDKVGVVSGEKVVHANEKDDASGAGESVYWLYESMVKKLEYKANGLVGTAGELFALRTSLYESPKPNVVIEDFWISIKIAMKGYIIAYEPKAFAIEQPSYSLREEFTRKTRIAAGDIQAFLHLPELLNPFKHGLLSIQYFSHKVLRWILAPLALMFFFMSNYFLVSSEHDYYRWMFYIQIGFYVLSFIGFCLSKWKSGIKPFFFPFYFVFMHFCMLYGWIKIIRRDNAVTWIKANRRKG